jgi:hypothetical protein
MFSAYECPRAIGKESLREVYKWDSLTDAVSILAREKLG